MKSTKKPSAIPPGPRAPIGSNPITMFRAEFDSAAKSSYPDAYNEPEDQSILWAMFLAGGRAASMQIATNAAGALARATDAEFKKVTSEPNAQSTPPGPAQ